MLAVLFVYFAGIFFANSSVIEVNACQPYGQRQYDHGQNVAMYRMWLDLRVSVIEFLEIKDILSLMKSCKFNLYSCRQFVHKLLTFKFHYLLRSSCAIKLNHLLKIPLIQSTKTNASRMHTYFNERSNKSQSIYIGIDRQTNNAFLSFWIKKGKATKQESKNITILFNETSIFVA